MLSSASIQKLERYATTGLSRCGGAGVLNNSNSTIINLLPFIKGSYTKSSEQTQKLRQGERPPDNSKDNTVQDISMRNSSAVVNSASNILVLMSEELWTNVTRIEENTSEDVGTGRKTSASVEEPLCDKGKMENLSSRASPTIKTCQQVCYSDLFILSIGFSMGMILYELENLNGNAVNNDKYRKLLECHLKCMKKLGRHNTVGGVSHTIVLVTLFNVIIDLTLLLLSKEPNSAYSMSFEDHQLILPIVMDLLITNAAQLRRACASHPLKKLMNPKLISSHIRETVKSLQPNVKLCLFQRMSLLLLHIKRCRYGYIGEGSKTAVCSSILSVMTPYLSSRSARYFVYFRGEVDDEKMIMAGCGQNDVASQVACLAFAITPPVGSEVADYLYSDDPRTRSHTWELLETWAASIPLIFSAFCEESSWALFAIEQRRKLLGSQALQKQKENKRNLRDQEKEIQKSMKEKAMAALLKAREEEAKATVNPYRYTGDDGRDDTTSSVGQTISQAESDVRSIMSAASFASYSTFLSVVNSEALERENRHLHESSDGNTNLPLILLEMCALSIYQTMATVKKAALAAVLKENEKTTTNGNSAMNRQCSVQSEEPNKWMALLPPNTMDNTVAFIDMCWSAVSGMFHTLSYHMSRQSITGVILFALPEDMQYNFGLGYQSLGLVFARLVVPALLHEGEGTGAIVGHSDVHDQNNNNGNDFGQSKHMEEQHEFTKWLSKIISRIEARHVVSTLEVYETVAPQVINQNLGAVLDACCTSSRPVDRILEIKKEANGVGTMVNKIEEQEIQQKQQQEYDALLGRIVERLGQSNQLPMVSSAILASCIDEPRGTQLSDDDDPAVNKTEKLQRIQNQEAHLRQTTISISAALVLLRSRKFRVVFSEAVNKTVDLEGLLSGIVEQVQKVMFPENSAGVSDEQTVEAFNESVNDTNSKQDSSRPSIAIGYDTIVILMHLCSLVVQGSNPTTTVAFPVLEKLTELDGYIVHGLVSAVAPLLRKEIPTPIGDTGTLHQIIYESIPCRKNLRRLFALMCEVLVRVRQALLRAMTDLGVDRLDEVMELLEESVWNCTSSTGNDDNVSLGAPIIGGGTHELTTETIGNYVTSSTRTPLTDFDPSSVFCKLAAQRLHLTISVATLLNRETNVNKVQEALLRYIFRHIEKREMIDHSSQYIIDVASSQECRTMILLNSEEWMSINETLSKMNDSLLKGEEKTYLPSVVLKYNCNKGEQLALCDTITSIPPFLQLSNISTLYKHNRRSIEIHGKDQSKDIIFDIIQQRSLWRLTGVVPNWLEMAGLLAASVVSHTATAGCNPPYIAALEALIDIFSIVQPAELRQKVMSVQITAHDHDEEGKNRKRKECTFYFPKIIASEEWLRALLLLKINSNNENDTKATSSKVVFNVVRKLVELLYVLAVSVPCSAVDGTLNAGHQFISNILTMSVYEAKGRIEPNKEEMDNKTVGSSDCLLLLQSLLVPRLSLDTSTENVTDGRFEGSSLTDEYTYDEALPAIKYLLPKVINASSLRDEGTADNSTSEGSRLCNIAIKLVKVLLKSVMMSADQITNHNGTDTCGDSQLVCNSSLLWVLLTTYLPVYFDAQSLFKIVYKFLVKLPEAMIKGVLTTLMSVCDYSQIVLVVCWFNLCAMALQHCCLLYSEHQDNDNVNEIPQPVPDVIVMLVQGLVDALFNMPYEVVHRMLTASERHRSLLPVDLLLVIPKPSNKKQNKKLANTSSTPQQLLQMLSDVAYTFVEQKCLQLLILKATGKNTVMSNRVTNSSSDDAVDDLRSVAELLLALRRASTVTTSDISNTNPSAADAIISPVTVVRGVSVAYFRQATTRLLSATSSICSANVAIRDTEDVNQYYRISHIKRLAALIGDVLLLTKTPLNTYYSCPAFVDSVFALYYSVLSWCTRLLDDMVITDVARVPTNTSAIIMSIYTTTMGYIIMNISFLMSQHPMVISKRAPMIPLLMRAVFQALLKGLETYEDVVNVHDTTSNNLTTSGDCCVMDVEYNSKDPTMLVGIFTSTLGHIIKNIDGDYTVSSSTSAISLNPTIGSKSFIAFTIASAILSSINTSRQLALFARYSDVLDLFGREIVSGMMKARLPNLLQGNIVQVTTTYSDDHNRGGNSANNNEYVNNQLSDSIRKIRHKKRRIEVSELSSYGLSRHLHYSDLCFAAIPQPENQALLRQYIMYANDDDGFGDMQIFNPNKS